MVKICCVESKKDKYVICQRGYNFPLTDRIITTTCQPEFSDKLSSCSSTDDDNFYMVKKSVTTDMGETIEILVDERINNFDHDVVSLNGETLSLKHWVNVFLNQEDKSKRIELDKNDLHKLIILYHNENEKELSL